MLTTADIAALQIEHFRSRARELPADIRGAVAVQIIHGALRSQSRRRQKADTEARAILRKAAAEVYLQAILETPRAAQISMGRVGD